MMIRYSNQEDRTMKRSILLAAIAALALTACRQDLTENESLAGGSVFTATVEGSETRTALSPNGNVYDMVWCSGDRITIVDGAKTPNVGIYETACTGTHAEFSLSDGSQAMTPKFKAYYPETLYNDGVPTLPTTQQYAEGNIAASPMYAESNSTSLAFKNLCGIIRINLSTALEGRKIRRIILDAAEGMSGEIANAATLAADGYEAAVAGSNVVVLDCGEEGVAIGETAVPFHIAVPAGTYTDFSVTVTTTDDYAQARYAKVNIKVARSSITTLTLDMERIGNIEVSSVQIVPETAELEPGQSLLLRAIVSPDNASDPTVTWSTDNASVATVTAAGNVTAVAPGTATITAMAGGKTATCLVNVVPSVAEKERAALIALYNATGGDNWEVKDNWCSDKPLNEWYGITTSNGHVTRISLGVNNLSGQIPPEIFSLANLDELYLHYNKLSGSIPAEIGNAETLKELHLQNNYLTGSLPESLYQMKNLRCIELWSNRISGDLSERFWDMPALEHLSLDDNLITGSLTSAVQKAKKLTWLGLGSNNLKGTIPPEISELKNLNYFSIENHAVENGSFTEAANDFYGTIPDNLDNLQNLKYFLVENNNLEGNVPVCFAKMPKLTGLELYGNKLSGEIAEELVECDNWDIWAPDANIIPQQKGFILSFSHYESTDYSQDGKVIRLQTHEKGNGISIVITGDCFTDQDIAAGEFETIARQTMEDFFGVEPFTTFRNLFDVYSVVAVSKTRYSVYGTALGAQFGEGSAVSCDEDKVKEYSHKALSNLDETLTIVIVNKNRNSGTAYMPIPTLDTDYGSGFSYACFGLQAQSAARRLLINHEANGHGFTKLLDEYYIRGGSPYPEENKPYIRNTYFARGYGANVDFESDPKKVKWSKFLFDDRYKYDGLGVFEGGLTFPNGVWRPSDNSIMAHQSESGEGSRFNAPSREAAYIRIHKLAYGSSWQYDYEEFVKYDAINRKTSASAAPSSAKASAASVSSSFSHTPPVILGKTWREVIHR